MKKKRGKKKKGVSLKKRRRLQRKHDSLAWQVARIMTKRKVVVPDWYRHESWCWDVFGNKLHCVNCYYQLNGCIKEVV